MTRYPSVMTPPINPSVPQGGVAPVAPASGAGWGDSLKQILPLLPALLSTAGGNKEALAAFMDSYQKTQAMLQNQGLQQDELAMRDRDRQAVLERQTEQDRIAAEDRARNHLYQDTERRMRYAGAVDQAVQGDVEDEGQVIEKMDALLALMPPEDREAVAAVRDANIRNAPKIVTASQKRQVKEWVQAYEKLDHVVNNPEANPGLPAPPHIVKFMPEAVFQGPDGKPYVRLFDAQRFADLPEGKPAQKPVRDPIDEYRQRKMIDREFDAPKEAPLMQVTETDPETGEIVTSMVPRRAGEVSRKPATTAKTSAEERKAAAFHRQMADAITTIDALESQLTEAELYQIQSLPQEALIGLANRNKLSEAAKRYLRAFEQFTEARLRPVSGAAIADSEYARDRRTYARQFGETPRLATDRKRARQTALQSLGEMAGGALPKDAAPAGGTVKMRAPNGQVRDVPADQVEHFKGLGAVVVKG